MRFSLCFVLLLGVLASVAGCGKSEPLPDLGSIPTFSLKDQTGSEFSQVTLRGQVWAAAFMFTRCPTICPALTKAMRSVQIAAAEAEVPLHLVSFSVDPDNDTPSVLSAYARKHGADLDTWTFVTGDSAVIQSTAEDGFKIALSGKADETKQGFGITHGSHLVLVDARGRIRGYYRSGDREPLQDLVRDAKRLVHERD